MTLAFGGDPSVLGWTITVAYALVAWRCLHAAGPRWFWITLGVLLALLCVNKQLDLQTLVTAGARAMAKEQGWYADRRGVQVAALVGGLTVVSVLAGIVAFSLRRDIGRLWPAMLGIVLIGVYAALRMTSIHEVDAFMVGGPLPVKWWGELTGLALIALSARKSTSI